MDFTPPAKDCRLCERLCSFREANRLKFPSYHNAPVEPFGSLDAEILIVGLAPGLNGANRTNRPFTNDYAGDVLYPVLKTYGLARGNYQKRKDDGYELVNVRITNAVRCVPPETSQPPPKKKLPAVPGCGNRRHAEFKGYPMPRHYLAQKRPSGAGTETVVCQIFPRRRISAAVRHSFLRRALLFFCCRFPCRGRPVLFIFRPRPAASLSRCAAFPLSDAYRQLSHLALQY